ncbi:MAG: SH3 domain-containing protein, partial [Heyndrickxia sp.]
MRKVALLLLSITLFLLPSMSFAAETSYANISPYIGTTNQDQVEMHRGATSDYKVVTKIPKNNEVIVIDSFKNNLNENWLRVIFNNTSGWVKADTITTSNFTATIMYTTSSADVRRGATKDYSVVSTISKSQKVSVIDRFVNSDYEIWYRVDLPSGIKGWVLSSCLTTEPVINSSDNQDIYIKQDNTSIHRGALSTYKVVANLPKDYKLHKIDEFTNNSGELWYRVEVNETLSGWVLASNTTETMEKSYSVSVDAANVRSAATASSDKVTTIKNGTHVTVTDQFTNDINELWYQIKLDDGTVGWILSSLVSPETSDVNTSGIIGTKNAQLRRGADYGYSVTATLPYQTSVQVLSTFYNKSGEKWLNIELSNGKKGWTPSYEVYNSLNDRTYV